LRTRLIDAALVVAVLTAWVAAGLARPAGLSGPGMLFNLVGSVLLFAIAWALRPDRRIGFGVVLAFHAAAWLGHAPGLSFVLSVGAVYLALRFLRATPSTRWFIHSGLSPAPVWPPRVRYAAIGGIAVVLVVLAAAEPLVTGLTGVGLTLAGLVTLVGLGLVRPW
jgi:hypothetical protein